MRHIFRLNVRQKGYALYSGDGLSQYQEFPLDVQSSDISQNYLSAQRRIDSFLETQVSRWCFCVANNNSGEFPVTAYGCFLQIDDDKGRTGISFIHAIESDDNLKIDQVVVSISQLLLQQTIGQLSELIAGVAKGTVTSDFILEFLTVNFKKHHQSSNYSLPRNRPIKEIKQDCGGASAATWLAMAISHLNSPAPWEIYEEYSYQTKLVSTVSSFNQATEKYSLSDYLYQIIREPELSKKSSEVFKRTPQKPVNSNSKVPPQENDANLTRSVTHHINHDQASIEQSSSWQVALSIGSLIIALISLIFLVSLKNEVASLQKQNAEFTNTIESLLLLLEM